MSEYQLEIGVFEGSGSGRRGRPPPTILLVGTRMIDLSYGIKS